MEKALLPPPDGSTAMSTWRVLPRAYSPMMSTGTVTRGRSKNASIVRL